jgi:hypothetical protein
VNLPGRCISYQQISIAVEYDAIDLAKLGEGIDGQSGCALSSAEALRHNADHSDPLPLEFGDEQISPSIQRNAFGSGDLRGCGACSIAAGNATNGTVTRDRVDGANAFA